MKYIKLFEDYNADKYLYHGTSYDNAISIINNGITEPIYLGDYDEAINYANSHSTPVLIRFSIGDIKTLIEPNYTLLNHYNSIIENSDNEWIDDDAMEIVDEWNNSKKKWLDSLNIFGSVILNSTVPLSDDDIIKLR